MTSMLSGDAEGNDKLDRRRTRMLFTAFMAVVGTAGLLVAATLAVQSRRGIEAAPPNATAEQSVATEAVVRRQDLRVTLQLTAVTARSEVAITAPDDSVLELTVAEGTKVATGDLIGRVVSTMHDPADARSAVADAELALNIAELDRSKAVDDANRALDSARQTMTRLQSRPLNDPADAEEVAIADAVYRQAEANLKDATERGDLDVDQATGQLRDRNADLAKAESSAMPVLATSAGTLRRTGPSTAAIDVGLVVRAQLLPTQLLRLRSGTATATATVETTGGKRQIPCREVLLSDASAPSPSSDSVNDLEASGGRLDCRLTEALDTVPGLSATVTVAIDFGSGVPVVPELAISFDDDGSPYVLTTAGRRIPVELGVSDGVLRVVEGVDVGTAVELR